MIAMALSCKPKLLIADEPTTALDVTIQAQILNLMKELREEMDTSIMLITHDLGVVAEMADKVVVMYAGQVVEETDVYTLFEQPLHPYTQGLMRSIPHIESDAEEALTSIPGAVPPLRTCRRAADSTLAASLPKENVCPKHRCCCRLRKATMCAAGWHRIQVPGRCERRMSYDACGT